MHTTPYSMVWFIENYNFRFLRSKFQPMMTSMIRISLSTTLNIYKTYFKSHQVQKPPLSGEGGCRTMWSASTPKPDKGG